WACCRAAAARPSLPRSTIHLGLSAGACCTAFRIMPDTLMSSSDIDNAMLLLGENARRASRAMMRASGAAKNRALLAMADALNENRAVLQAANAKDLAAARANGLEAALLDRLTLSDNAIDKMAEGLRQIANLPDPIGGTTAGTIRPNGMRVSQMRVPLGV